jgi:hypothetical protein
VAHFTQDLPDDFVGIVLAVPNLGAKTTEVAFALDQLRQRFGRRDASRRMPLEQGEEIAGLRHQAAKPVEHIILLIPPPRRCPISP